MSQSSSPPINDIESALKLLNYMCHFYPTQSPQAIIFLVQECFRIVEAREFESHGDAAYTGWPALRSITQKLPFVRSMCPQLADEIETKLASAQGKQNVREEVKSIWTFPMRGFLPWCDISDPCVTAPILGALNNFQGHLSLNKGRVFLNLENLTEMAWKARSLHDVIEGFTLEKNLAESEHVTVVNSNVVAKCGEDRVCEFLKEQGNTAIAVKVTDVKHTISLDWARFSLCVVLMIKSDALNSFVEAFNIRFPQANVRADSFHVTVAVLCRK